MQNLEIIKSKIFTLPTIYHQLNIWRFLQQKIVFTNGCFDIVHLGHLNYLSKAANLGNKLIIGLNSDASTKKLKGNNRQINDELTRSHLLASLFFVDAVIVFDEQTPESLINRLLPDVLVKSADYETDNMFGATAVINNGGKVATVPFIQGYSTSAIEKRIIETRKK